MKNKNPINKKELKENNKVIEEQQKNIKNPKTEETKKDKERNNNNKKANTIFKILSTKIKKNNKCNFTIFYFSN